MAASKGFLGGLLALALAAGGCGGASHPPTNSGAFAWLRPAAAPRGWPAQQIPTGAVLAYPSGWRPASGDRGSATAALRGPGGSYIGYLNITPRQGDENNSDWRTFRPRHNAQEGARDVVTFASATGLHFRTGVGACVRDGYTTVTGNQFIELACLVRGRRAETVIVGATTPRTWAEVAPVLERAISAFMT